MASNHMAISDEKHSQPQSRASCRKKSSASPFSTQHWCSS
eukprot:CAMPEP_0115359926 /NCGR_PEP_ID=MMETSP0270-20121206/101421_1 /TAXON_ID=71861 /ORGANISM="Scrippsiella trochoidea, Strain CCMP3099" /LENGTH=39 /DNA_ID= /DNA_START= /DNA_END= /DNA_ORIENTATION=